MPPGTLILKVTAVVLCATGVLLLASLPAKAASTHHSDQQSQSKSLVAMVAAANAQAQAAKEQATAAAAQANAAESVAKAVTALHSDESKKNEGDSKLASYTLGLEIATIFLAIGTVVLAWFGYRQLGEAQKAAALSEKVANAAEDSALAAKRSADLNERAHATLQRPWLLSLIPADAVVHGSDGLPAPALRPRFHNVGKLPAVIEELRISLAKPNEMPGKPDYTATYKHPVQREYLDQDQLIEGAEIILPSNFRNPHTLVLYGEITYSGLKEGVYHTGFAYEIEAPLYVDGALQNGGRVTLFEKSFQWRD